MLAPIRSRQAFSALSRRGRRSRSGPVWVLSTSGSDDASVEVSFAVSRKVGRAVVRNTIRRRLRVVMRELDAANGLTPGRYLVGVAPAAAELDFQPLRAHVRAALEAGR